MIWTLGKLLNLPCGSAETLPVRGLSVHSGSIQPGDVFFALKGTQVDAHDFALDAQSRGASVIVGERPRLDLDLKVPYLSIPRLAEELGSIASRFYGDPSHSMQMIGVTGTSGKTTTTHILESIFQAAGKQVGLIGTIENRFAAIRSTPSLTTPGPLELQRLLAEMKQAGVEVVLMEVSSHALHQHRVSGIAWDVGVFLNLSHDHLDYHRTLDAYFEAKLLLFSRGLLAARQNGKSPLAVLETRSEWGPKALDRIKDLTHLASVVTTSTTKRDLRFSLGGVDGTLQTHRGLLKVRSPLLGKFNAQNLEMAMTVAQELGIASGAIEAGVSRLGGIPGRMEPVPIPKGRVFVDYAHKPEALRKALEELRGLMDRGGKLLTVFGCGGNRDRAKRPVMGQIAAAHSDLLWITSDNPRKEDPEAIIEEILQGLPQNFPAQVISDRKEAIESALAALGDKDVLFIAGKGHENYQLLGETRHPFSDRNTVIEWVAHTSPLQNS